jgi:hypothetical protein
VARELDKAPAGGKRLQEGVDGGRREHRDSPIPLREGAEERYAAAPEG